MLVNALADQSSLESKRCYNVEEEKMNGIVKTYAEMQLSLIASQTPSEFRPSDALGTS
jgi:hypothetical protein